jgi:ATPase subunit of ABC transporter with duplicated ATPase domains
MKQILALSHARKSYAGKVVLDDVTLAFLPGAKIGVVGPNGMGKSTLLRLMAGLVPRPPPGRSSTSRRSRSRQGRGWAAWWSRPVIW